MTQEQQPGEGQRAGQDGGEAQALAEHALTQDMEPEAGHPLLVWP